jgi:hypothetical protein
LHRKPDRFGGFVEGLFDRVGRDAGTVQFSAERREERFARVDAVAAGGVAAV